MTNNQQLAYRLIQQEHIKRLGTDELALLRNRRQQKSVVINPSFTGRILNTIAVASIASTCLFGIGTLSCWGLEIIEANTKSISLSKEHEWQTRKHICLGWMLVQGKRISNPIDTVVLGFSQSTNQFQITTLSQGVGLTFSSLCGQKT